MKVWGGLVLITFALLALGACLDGHTPTSPGALHTEAPTATQHLAKGARQKVVLCHRRGHGDFAPIEVSSAAEHAHRSHGDGAIGDPVPSDPAMVFDDDCQPTRSQFTFAFQGVIGLACFVCGPGSDQFGSGVPPGTPFHGTFTFDSNTLPTQTGQPTRVSYFGVSVELTVGLESVDGNDPTVSLIQIHDGPPSGDSYSVIAQLGFGNGSIAGRAIDDFIWVVSGTASLFSDLSLPTDPGFFEPSLGSRVCIGDCFDGEILEGRITNLTPVP